MSFLGIIGIALLIIGVLVLVHVLAAVLWLGWVLAIVGGLILLGFVGTGGHYWR